MSWREWSGGSVSGGGGGVSGGLMGNRNVLLVRSNRDMAVGHL